MCFRHAQYHQDARGCSAGSSSVKLGGERENISNKSLLVSCASGESTCDTQDDIDKLLERRERAIKRLQGTNVSATPSERKTGVHAQPSSSAHGSVSALKSLLASRKIERKGNGGLYGKNKDSWTSANPDGMDYLG